MKCRKQIRYVLCVAFLYYYMKNHALGNLYHVRSLRTLGKFQCLKFFRHRLTSFKREWLLRTPILLGQDGWFLTSLIRPDIVCVNYDLRPLRILSVWHHRNSAIPELWYHNELNKFPAFEIIHVDKAIVFNWFLYIFSGNGAYSYTKCLEYYGVTSSRLCHIQKQNQRKRLHIDTERTRVRL